jgi:porin
MWNYKFPYVSHFIWPSAIPATWGGDLWSRPRLTGSWGGLRDALGKKGVVLDLDLLQLPQDVASGGRDEVLRYFGLAEYTLNVDTQKLGLWPGGFLRVPRYERLRANRG